MHSLVCRSFLVGAITLTSGPGWAQDMGGPDGVLALLKARGYQVEQL